MKRARVWRFGDNVDTDLIIPGKYLDNYDPDHLARHAMEGASKDFASRVSRGDVIVAGSNFGCGSSREQAVTALKHAGVRAVIAKSFARIFYRNAVNLGLTVVVSPDAVNLFHDRDAVMFSGDRVELTAADGNRKAHLEPVPPHLKKILDKGGLIPYIKETLKSQ